MNPRINYSKHSGANYKRLFDMSQASKEVMDPTILDLIDIRASQLNGCAFCLDMHVKEAKIHGERELRLYHISVWRESHLFTDKERAALEWTEAVTLLNGHGISNKVYENVSQHLTEKELSDLTIAIGLINMWNRLNVSSPVTPGAYDSMFGLTKAGLN